MLWYKVGWTKQSPETHYQYQNKLEVSQQMQDSNRFGEVDQSKFTFKHLVLKYIQYNDQCSAQKVRDQVVSTSSGSSTSMKDQPIKDMMKLADLMTEASNMKQKKLQERPVEKVKINTRIEGAKTWAKIIEGQEQKFGEMAKHENLDYKLSEKLPFSQNDFDYLYDNSAMFYVPLLQIAINIIQNEQLRMKVMMKVKKVLQTWFVTFSSNKRLKWISLVAIL